MVSRAKVRGMAQTESTSNGNANPHQLRARTHTKIKLVRPWREKGIERGAEGHGRGYLMRCMVRCHRCGTERVKRKSVKGCTPSCAWGTLHLPPETATVYRWVGNGRR